MTEYAPVPDHIVDAVRSICLALPETLEEQSWAGTRWCVRKRNFAHVLCIDQAGGPVTVMTFRAAEPELAVLHNSGHPFFRAGWGTNVVGMVLGDDVDWAEVTELLTESFCVLAPKKLVALVPRPE